MIVASRKPLAYYEMSFSLDLDVDTAKVVVAHSTIGRRSRYLSHGPKRTLQEVAKPLQSLPDVHLWHTAKHRMTKFHSQLCC